MGYEALIGALGYPGIFALSLALSATFIFGPPAMIIPFTAGAMGLDIFLVGILSGTGAALGEVTGYALGRGGERIAQLKHYGALLKYQKPFRRYGGWMLTAFAFFPLPVDLAGMLAGLMKYDIRKFVFFIALGKIPRNILVAYAGAVSAHWLLRWVGGA